MSSRANAGYLKLSQWMNYLLTHDLDAQLWHGKDQIEQLSLIKVAEDINLSILAIN